MLAAYQRHVAERALLGIPPLPLSAEQTAQLVELLKNPPPGEDVDLVELLAYRVPAGVDDAARVKASYLAAVAHGTETCALIDRAKATELLGTMLGGYNIHPLIELLDDESVGAIAAESLKKTLLVFDAFHDVKEKADRGNANAKAVLQSWADAEWFTSRPEVPESITVSIFKVVGETNTDDLSPAPDAWSRPDIPLHALALLKNARPGITPEQDGKRGPIRFIEDLRARGHLVAYAGDVVGTGSSRKSATNSVLWFTGEDIPYVPNKRFGGVCLGSKIAPIFYNTMEDAGALPIEVDVSAMNMGDVVELRPYEGKALKDGQVIAEFKVRSEVLFDEVRAGGRIPLIVGRGLTAKAREALGLPPSTLFRLPHDPADTGRGYTLAQKMVGKACGLPEDSRPAEGRAPRHLLRAAHDLGRQPGHHRPDDPRRAEGPGLPRLLGRPGDAELLPHRGLSEAGRREDASRAARLHQHPRRHQPAPGRRRHPQLAQPPAAARHGGHRRRQPHALSDRHQLPRRLGAGGLRRRHRRDAARHARERAGALQGRAAARRDAARPGQRDPALRHPAGPADRRQAGQEEHLLGPHPGDRGAAAAQGRAGVRAVATPRPSAAPPAARCISTPSRSRSTSTATSR